MKKGLVTVFFATSSILLSLGCSSLIADDSASKDKNTAKENLEEKFIDVSAGGKLTKEGDSYILVTFTQNKITLPVPKEKDSNVKLENFVGKTVTVKGKGKMIKANSLEEIPVFKVVEGVEILKLGQNKEDKPEGK